MSQTGVDAVHDMLGQDRGASIGSPSLASFAAVAHNHGRPYKTGAASTAPRPTPNTTLGKAQAPR